MTAPTSYTALSEALAPIVRWLDAIDANPEVDFSDEAAIVSRNGAIVNELTGADLRRVRAAAKTHLPELMAEHAAMREALKRAERKLAAYVGVCEGDKELTNTVLPMVQNALASSARTEGRNLDGSERREAVAVKVEPLADFAIWAVVNAIFEGGDLDWLETQEKAEELGIIVPEIYDLEKHGPYIEAEPGDTIFVLNEHLAARRSSNEEGGR